jgi:hypothetical protein
MEESILSRRRRAFFIVSLGFFFFMIDRIFLRVLLSEPLFLEDLRALRVAIIFIC